MRCYAKKQCFGTDLNNLHRENFNQVNCRILCFLFFASLFGNVDAQATWRMAYGAYGPEEGRSVKIANDGNFVIAGSTGSFGSGTSDIYLIKLDGDGVVLWTRTIGGPMIEQANDLVQLSDGGWLIVGSTNDFSGAGGYDGLLIRTDANGNVLWRKEYGGDDWDFFHSGILMDDGGFLMVGQTFSQGDGGDAWIVRTTQVGDTIWTQHYGGPGIDDGGGVVESTDGGFVFAGSLTSGNGDLDAYVVKVDGQLGIEWENVYGGDSLDVARDVILTQDGGYSIVGVTKSFSEFTEHYHFKLDAGGALQWQKHWGQINDQEAYRHIELPSGGFATTGWTTTSGGGGKDMFIFLCDQQGAFIEQHTFGGMEDDEGYSLAKTSDGFIICGATLSYGAGSDDVFVVRADSTGSTTLETVSTYFDPTPVDEVLNERGQTPFPNPSSGIVHLPEGHSYAKLDLFDLSGRVLQFWNKPDSDINVSGFLSGSFYLRATDHDGATTTFPLLLIKP